MQGQAHGFDFKWQGDFGEVQISLAFDHVNYISFGMETDNQSLSAAFSHGLKYEI